MKKTLARISIVLIIVLSMATPVLANDTPMSLFIATYAGNTENNFSGFEITSGLLKQFEGTFDSTRTVIGSAPKDTQINLFVYQYDEADKSFSLVSELGFTVGSAGIFTSTIDLSIGENYILLIGDKNTQKFVRTALIKHKNPEIKLELVQSGASVMLPAHMLGR